MEKRNNVEEFFEWILLINIFVFKEKREGVRSVKNEACGHPNK